MNKSRTYRQKARDSYLALSKRRKRSRKAIRKTIKQQYIDSVDRIEVERSFSLCKRKFGLGCVTTKREDTTKTSVYM